MTLNLRLTESIKGIASTFSCLQLPPLCVLGAQRRTRFYLYIYIYTVHTVSIFEGALAGFTHVTHESSTQEFSQCLTPSHGLRM